MIMVYNAVCSINAANYFLVIVFNSCETCVACSFANLFIMQHVTHSYIAPYLVDHFVFNMQITIWLLNKYVYGFDGPSKYFEVYFVASSLAHGHSMPFSRPCRGHEG